MVRNFVISMALSVLTWSASGCVTAQPDSVTPSKPTTEPTHPAPVESIPAAAPAGTPRATNTAPITLTGGDLSVAQVVRIARDGVAIEISKDAEARVEKAHRLLLFAAEKNHAVYGLNRGVGLNKDKTIFQGGSLLPEARRASEQFNRNMLHSHAAAVGPEMSEEQVRAILTVRLNTMLQGNTGAQPYVAQMYREFLNRQIHPVIPSRGSVGEADIAILPHIGLAMIGEGEVHYRGERMAAAQALAKAGLKPLAPYGKDSLSILSSNAASAGLGALILHDTRRALKLAELVLSLSLEGLNGNVAPLLGPDKAVRPYRGQGEASKRIRSHLAGSYLWQLSDARALQDPLSFRSASQIHGAADDALHALEREFIVQLNSSDDNPVVIVGIRPAADAPPQVKAYFMDNGKDLFGAVIPTANFEPIPWVIPYQALAVALVHVSHASVQRMNRLGNDKFTKLSRFLAPDDKTIAFGTIQKSYVSLHTEIRSLSDPISPDSFPVAGEIEDHATNAVGVVKRVGRIVDNLYYILGIELMHAAQAVDLRRRQDSGLQLGQATGALHAAFRRVVPFLAKDRTLTYDIARSHDFLQQYTGAGIGR